MKILVVGEEYSQAEFKAKFKDIPDTLYKNSSQLTTEDLKGVTVVFDFYSGDDNHFSLYHDQRDLLIFTNIVLTTLGARASKYDLPKLLVGFNGLPSMFDRAILEVSVSIPEHQRQVDQVCQSLQTQYQLVQDRVGMVTPRVVCMIINEAFFTAQEGTASSSDIDLGMKLGTRYPAGPFEMCQSLGVKNVFEVLDALYNDTHDERYKICPALKTAYLQAN